MSEKFYHGGKPGLRPGDMILPPNETGAPCSSDFIKTSNPHQRDRIYVATELAGAIFYAAMYPASDGGFGDVYEVEAIGPLEADPDCDLPGLSWQTSRARIISRVRVKNKLMSKVRRSLMAQPA